MVYEVTFSSGKVANYDVNSLQELIDIFDSSTLAKITKIELVNSF